MKKARRFVTGLLFGAGLALSFAPGLGNLRNQQHQEQILSTYESAEAAMEASEAETERKQAALYNEWIYGLRTGTGIARAGQAENLQEYESLLNMTGTGMMGSLEIPRIDVDLPIYHGTSQEVLAAGVGHLEGSSLPVGGTGTRCVLTGHRGLPGSRLFTRLDELREGDLLFLRILGEVLAYRVSEIAVIEPEDVERLRLEEGQDLLSLVTCTPYGINTERLVVTGTRVPYSQALYEGEEPGIPSIRELLFAALPFLFSGAAAGIWIKKHRAGGKGKEVQKRTCIKGKERNIEKAGG